MITNTLISLGVEALKGLILDVFKRKGNDLINRFDFDLKNQYRDLDRETSNYVKNYVARHNNVKILTMRREDVNLQDVYTESKLLLSPQDSNSFDSMGELEQKYQEVRDLASFNRSSLERTPAVSYVKKHSKLVILGGPGSGKSTLLRKIGLDSWKDARINSKSDQRLPVFIEIRGIVFHKFDIRKAILHELSICGFKKYGEAIVESLLNDGKFLIILDGLDEVLKEHRARAIDSIQNFSDEYNQNKFLVSCRVAAYKHKRLRSFRDVELAAFDDSQIQTAIQKWFGADADKARGCWNKLCKEEFKTIKKLATTPLLLILICIYYQNKGNFPSNRSILYERAVQVLMEDWNASKGIVGQEGEELNIRQKEILLETIAYNAFKKGYIFIFESWIVDHINKTLEDMGLSEKVRGAQILESMEIEHGLLVKQSNNIYSFSHETIQEFLCAQHISEKNSRLKTLVNDEILSDRWQEVFMFMSGLRQAEDLLVVMNQKAEEMLIHSDSLKWFFKWVSEATSGSTLQHQPIVRRMIANHLALCLYLYVSYCGKSRLLTPIIRDCIKNSQQLIRDFENYIPQDLLRPLYTFEKFVSKSIIIRSQVEKDYRLALKGDEGKIRMVNIKGKLSSIFRFSNTSIALLESGNIFRSVNTERLQLKTHDGFKQALSNVSKPMSCSDFCDNLYFEWIRALRIDEQKLKRMYINDLRSLCSYLYCLSLMKKCGDTATHISRRKWLTLESKMLCSLDVETPWH